MKVIYSCFTERRFFIFNSAILLPAIKSARGMVPFPTISITERNVAPVCEIILPAGG